MYVVIVGLLSYAIVSYDKNYNLVSVIKVFYFK